MNFSLLSSIAVIAAAIAPTVYGQTDCVVCDGPSYHIFIKGPTSFGAALRATPEGCVLAPVTGEEDWVGINSALDDDNDNYAYIGVYKPMEDYMQECPMLENAPCNVLTSGWLNLDGSEVPDMPDYWDTNHPVSSVGSGRNYGGFHGSGGMRSFRAAHNPDFMDGAVYKCCIPVPGSYCVDSDGTAFLEWEDMEY